MTRILPEKLRRMPRMKGLEDLEHREFPKRARFPELVDIVTAKDIYCEALSGNGTHMKHCLLGLSCVNFGHGERGEPLRTVRFTVAENYVNDELKASVRAFTGDPGESVVDFNDGIMGDGQKYWIAKVWNATMARIGYTEGNPEAK